LLLRAVNKKRNNNNNNKERVSVILYSPTNDVIGDVQFGWICRMTQRIPLQHWQAMAISYLLRSFLHQMPIQTREMLYVIERERESLAPHVQ
jgi:hypothetical protein